MRGRRRRRGDAGVEVGEGAAQQVLSAAGSTPEAKGVLAIMCGSLLENGAGSTELREASIAEFRLDLHSATIAPT